MSHTSTKKKIVFSDIKNDLSLSSSGGLALVFDEGSVKQSILTILTTKLGERVMLPTFGSIIHEYLFEPMDYITEIQIKSAIITSLVTWEDRIQITGVRITAEPDNNSYIIEVRYNIILTKQTDVFIGRISAAEEVAATPPPATPTLAVIPPAPTSPSPSPSEMEISKFVYLHAPGYDGVLDVDVDTPGAFMGVSATLSIQNTPLCTLLGSSSIPGYMVPGCIIPGT